MGYFQQKYQKTPKYKEILVEGPPHGVKNIYNVCHSKIIMMKLYQKQKVNQKKKAEQLGL